MSWPDRVIASTSWIFVAINSADVAFAGARPIPLTFGIGMLLVVSAFHFLRAGSGQQQELTLSRIVDSEGNPVLLTSSKARVQKAAIYAARLLLIAGCVTSALALWLQRTQPSLSVNIDKVEQFSLIEGNQKITYTTAGTFEGLTVYGRGQTLTVALKNNSKLPIDIGEVRLRLVRYFEDVPIQLRYDKLLNSLPHTRLPIEQLVQTIVLRDPNELEIAVGEGRVRLGATGTDSDTHVMKFTVEAREGGLWIFTVEAEYNEVRTGSETILRAPRKMALLLRGT